MHPCRYRFQSAAAVSHDNWVPPADDNMICVKCHACMHAGKPEDVVAAHARVCEALGAPEVLVYNAGPGGYGWPPPAALDISPEAFSRSFDSGVTGALVWAQQVLWLIASASEWHPTLQFPCGWEVLAMVAKMCTLSLRLVKCLCNARCSARLAPSAAEWLHATVVMPFHPPWCMDGRSK